jgi:hypothetical protein
VGIELIPVKNAHDGMKWRFSVRVPVEEANRSRQVGDLNEFGECRLESLQHSEVIGNPL